MRPQPANDVLRSVVHDCAQAIAEGVNVSFGAGVVVGVFVGAAVAAILWARFGVVADAVRA